MLDPSTRQYIGPLAFDGGLTKSHALLNDSAARDKADAANFLTRDQRGSLRQSGFVNGVLQLPDIGAYEASENRLQGVLFIDQNLNGIRDVGELGMTDISIRSFPAQTRRELTRI